MNFSLAFKRKFKATFLRYNLHKLVRPFEGALLNLAYMSKFSAWRAAHSQPAFNDFYLHQWDYTKRYALYDFLITHENLNSAVNYLEFGVAQGFSFKWWLQHNTHTDSRFYGFDTFTGLPEAWDQYKAGDMSTGGQVPEVNDKRATFVKGLFQDTLPGFLQTFTDDKRKMIHVDADLYSSTLYVLTRLEPLLKDGDIILFDEFGVPTHEFLAFINFQSAYGTKLELIAAANNYFFTAFKVKKS